MGEDERMERAMLTWLERLCVVCRFVPCEYLSVREQSIVITWPEDARLRLDDEAIAWPDHRKPA